jgi:hypothetical protein
MALIVPQDAPAWAHRLATDIDRQIARLTGYRAPVRLTAFEKTDLPSAASYTGCLIFVPDATGGPIPAYSDGTTWKRVTDATVIS